MNYAVAFLDWLACAVGGAEEPAARAAAALDDDVVSLGTAGHVLDFDDTYPPGLAHLSAPTAPASLVVGAQVGATVEEMLNAYGAGFEAMAALSAANHPGIRVRGWHPTAVCGVVGAAVAAAALLEADRRQSVRLALLQASGLQAAFGSDGKALQVGLAAAAGVRAARLAAAGATVGPEVIAGFEEAYGARWASVDPDKPLAIHANWIKAYPCCLQTHSAIEAADAVWGSDAEFTVVVHPISRRTAFRDDVATGLEAKFSLPYLVAYTLLHGPPEVGSFREVDAEARALAARRVRVRVDESLAESEALIEVDGRPATRVEAALGCPARPMDRGALQAKVRSLAGRCLDGLLDNPSRPALDVLAALSDRGPVPPLGLASSRTQSNRREAFVATINKTELAKAVADETGLTNGQAKEAIEATLEQIANNLGAGNEVSLPGFGKFAISERSARQGRNPQTGETIQIAASKVPRFSAAAPLKAALKG